MINHRVQKYIEDHSFCSEYLFKDWEAFLDFIYEEGGRVSSILWWEHCKKNFQHGYGGYSDPDDRELNHSETWFHEDGFEEKSLADIKAYIHETREHGLILGDKYITHDLVPSFYLVCRSGSAGYPESQSGPLCRYGGQYDRREEADHHRQHGFSEHGYV